MFTPYFDIAVSSRTSSYAVSLRVTSKYFTTATVVLVLIDDEEYWKPSGATLANVNKKEVSWPARSCNSDNLPAVYIAIPLNTEHKLFITLKASSLLFITTFNENLGSVTEFTVPSFNLTLNSTNSEQYWLVA